MRDPRPGPSPGRTFITPGGTGRTFFADSTLPRLPRESTFGLYASGTLETRHNVIARELGL